MVRETVNCLCWKAFDCTSEMGSIALQTAQAILRIKDGKQPVRCRVMLDSGSQRSFVTTAIAKLLGGKPMEKEWMRINGFGVTEPKGKLCNILELCVSPVNGGESVKTNACEVPFISKGLENHHVEAMTFEFPTWRSFGSPTSQKRNP